MLICIIEEYLLTLLYLIKSIQISFRKIYILHKKYSTNTKRYQTNLKQRSSS